MGLLRRLFEKLYNQSPIKPLDFDASERYKTYPAVSREFIKLLIHNMNMQVYKFDEFLKKKLLMTPTREGELELSCFLINAVFQYAASYEKEEKRKVLNYYANCINLSIHLSFIDLEKRIVENSYKGGISHFTLSRCNLYNKIIKEYMVHKDTDLFCRQMYSLLIANPLQFVDNEYIIDINNVLYISGMSPILADFFTKMSNEFSDSLSKLVKNYDHLN